MHAVRERHARILAEGVGVREIDDHIDIVCAERRVEIRRHRDLTPFYSDGCRFVDKTHAEDYLCGRIVRHRLQDLAAHLTGRTDNTYANGFHDNRPPYGFIFHQRSLYKKATGP